MTCQQTSQSNTFTGAQHQKLQRHLHTNKPSAWVNNFSYKSTYCTMYLSSRSACFLYFISLDLCFSRGISFAITNGKTTRLIQKGYTQSLQQENSTFLTTVFQKCVLFLNIHEKDQLGLMYMHMKADRYTYYICIYCFAMLYNSWAYCSFS